MGSQGPDPLHETGYATPVSPSQVPVQPRAVGIPAGQVHAISGHRPCFPFNDDFQFELVANLGGTAGIGKAIVQGASADRQQTRNARAESLGGVLLRAHRRQPARIWD